MTTTNIKATEFASANEAVQETDASGGNAIVITDASGARRFLVLDDAEVQRLEAAGVAFAIIEPLALGDGFTTILATIPVNNA